MILPFRGLPVYDKRMLSVGVVLGYGAELFYSKGSYYWLLERKLFCYY